MPEHVKSNQLFKENDWDGETYQAWQLVVRACDGSSYGSGTIETLQSSTDKTAGTLARLVQALFDKDILSKEEVYKIAGR